jgi:hypothetical protein
VKQGSFDQKFDWVACYTDDFHMIFQVLSCLDQDLSKHHVNAIVLDVGCYGLNNPFTEKQITYQLVDSEKVHVAVPALHILHSLWQCM